MGKLKSIFSMDKLTGLFRSQNQQIVFETTMDNKGMTMEKMPSVISINGPDNNMSSTLKLAENDVMEKNAKNLETEKSDADFYNPFDYRDKTHATPDVGALLHLLKSSLGTGILAMPMAFKNGGLIFGIFGTIIVGYICTHCVHMLVRCSQLLSSRVKQPSLGFPETAETAFKTGPEKYRKWAKFSWVFVKVSLFATYYFGNTVYVVFIAKSFEQVIENHTSLEMNIRLYILLLAIPLIPLGIIRSLKYLVPFSAMATAFIMFGLAITLYYTFTDLPDIETRHYITNVQQWPLFFSTVLFAMEGIGTVLPIENSMQNPNHFLGCPGVLNIAMSVVVILYGAVGFFGYVKYGDTTEGSITLNLPESALAESVKILVALSILFTYGLQFSVPSEIMWKLIGHKISERFQTSGYYLMRAAMIFGTVIIAIIIPDLSPFISLVGAVCFSILGLFCPAVIEAITYYDEGYGPLKIRLIKDIVIMLMSVFSLVSGSYISITDIIEFYRK